MTGGAVAAALLMLNPDVLYLQSTPMTEPLLFGTTFLAIALIAEWAATVAPDPPRLRRPLSLADSRGPTTTAPAGPASRRC